MKTRPADIRRNSKAVMKEAMPLTTRRCTGNKDDRPVWIPIGSRPLCPPIICIVLLPRFHPPWQSKEPRASARGIQGCLHDARLSREERDDIRFYQD